MWLGLKASRYFFWNRYYKDIYIYIFYWFGVKGFREFTQYHVRETKLVLSKKIISHLIWGKF